MFVGVVCDWWFGCCRGWWFCVGFWAVASFGLMLVVIGGSVWVCVAGWVGVDLVFVFCGVCTI